MRLLTVPILLLCPVPREFRALKTALFDACKAANKEALVSILQTLSGSKAAKPGEDAAEQAPPPPPPTKEDDSGAAVPEAPLPVPAYCLLSPTGSDPEATPVVEKKPVVEWEARAQLERRNSSSESPSVATCCEVVRSHSLEQRLLSGPIDSSDTTLLHYCAKHSAVKLIQCLLEAGADPAVKCVVTTASLSSLSFPLHSCSCIPPLTFVSFHPLCLVVHFETKSS